MIIAEWKEYFDTLQDKSGSPFFSDTQKSLFFNRAIIDFVSSKLPGNERDSVELGSDETNDIAPLIYSLPVLNMTSTGILAKSTVSAALTGILANSSVWRVLNVGWKIGSKFYPVKSTRHNDWYEFEQNYFKRGSNDAPRYKEDYTSYVFSPINTSAKIYMTVLKYPIIVDIATNVNSDLPDSTHNMIIAIALEMAGISSRDEALAQLLQLQAR